MMDEDIDLELPSEIHDRITELSGLGERLFEAGRYEEAIARYVEAFRLVPEPQSEWRASTWLMAAIGDAAFQARDFDKARRALEYGMQCPGAIGNPFMHLRLGQALLELGEEDRAADELIRAYMAEGRDIFASEDPKYLAFLSTRARID